jgi:glyoxylase-like metal-dependent hydrolase (beta-lactamase superfamily II)
VAGAVRRVVPLTFGWEHLPKTVSVWGADPALRLRCPVPGVLCEVDGGWFLLDAGFNAAFLRDPPLRRRLTNPDYDVELVSDDRDCLTVAFETVGIDPGTVVGVGLSHLHLDHAGGLRWFVAPGITAVARTATAGHQPAPPGGDGFVFAFVAADLQENLDHERAPGSFVIGEAEAVESIRRLKAIAAEKGYPLIPGHDPDVWPAFTAALGVPGPP